LIIENRAYARVGLIGNPSDGYYGKTISAYIRNFSAKVVLWESPTLEIIPNLKHDPTHFHSLEQLVSTARRDGYYGGLRLLLAACKRFKDYCDERGVALPDRNFTVTYDTNIPRQVGLGGSSAIIVALFRCLMEFFEVREDFIGNPFLPNLVLSVERDELDITAGLQDRVIQVYGGTVYMDFNQQLMERDGHGDYQRIDSALLPPLFLAYALPVAHPQLPTESGKVHGALRYRYERGEPEVLKAMERWAMLADKAKRALEEPNHEKLGELMNANFDLRRKVLGDATIGSDNLRMIQIARDLGHPVKFSGSGGAVVGMYGNEEERQCLRDAYKAEGFRFCKVKVDRDGRLRGPRSG